MSTPPSKEPDDGEEKANSNSGKDPFGPNKARLSFIKFFRRESIEKIAYSTSVTSSMKSANAIANAVANEVKQEEAEAEGIAADGKANVKAEVAKDGVSANKAGASA